MIRMEVCEYCGQTVPERCDNSSDAEDCIHLHGLAHDHSNALRRCYGLDCSRGGLFSDAGSQPTLRADVLCR
jgi:hypothetical protein